MTERATIKGVRIQPHIILDPTDERFGGWKDGECRSVRLTNNTTGETRYYTGFVRISADAIRLELPSEADEFM